MRRIADWSAYVASAVLIVILTWMFATHQARTGGSPELPTKWLGFAGMTAIIFGYAMRACRRSWAKQRFWVFFGVFFAVHCGVGVSALSAIPTVPLILYGLLAGIEYVALAAYLGYFLRDQ